MAAKVICMAKKKAEQVARRRDIPATLGMLHDVRDDLKSEIKSVEYNMNGKFARVEARFSEMDARFAEVHAKFDLMDARFAEMDAKFDLVDGRFAEMDAKFDLVNARLDEMNSKLETMVSRNHQMHLLFEEQNQTNRIARDVLLAHLDALARLSGRVDNIEKMIEDFRR